MTRVKVFIDYQNTYMLARETFGEPAVDRFTFGQVYPRRIGVLLKQRGDEVDPDRELLEVRVYRGEPDAQRSATGQAACQRQVRFWGAQAAVSAITRPLRYRPVKRDSAGRPTHWHAEEKGIDVLIALDMVVGALRNEYDLAVLLSADTDLAPAVERVLDAGKRVELAAWCPDHGWMPRLHVPDRRLWCHMLRREDFGRVRDDTDYTRPVGTPTIE